MCGGKMFQNVGWRKCSQRHYWNECPNGYWLARKDGRSIGIEERNFNKN